MPGYQNPDKNGEKSSTSKHLFEAQLECPETPKYEFRGVGTFLLLSDNSACHTGMRVYDTAKKGFRLKSVIKYCTTILRVMKHWQFRVPHHILYYPVHSSPPGHSSLLKNLAS
jgi:hypothetical protein